MTQKVRGAKWTQEQKNKLKEMYLDKDVSLQEISEYFGLSIESIYSIASMYGLSRRDAVYFKVTPEIAEVIKMHIIEGLTMAQSAEYLGTNKSTLYREMKRVGMKWKIEVPPGFHMCSKCREVKPFTHYNKCKKAKTGRESCCRECRSEINRQKVIDKRIEKIQNTKITGGFENE